MVERPRGKANPQYKAKEREAFFRRLDRGGTIRAVAAELGLSVDSCYRWRREAQVATPRGKNRPYSAEEKAASFLRLGLVGNEAQVNKELGFGPVTYYSWAAAAGIFTGIAARP